MDNLFNNALSSFENGQLEKSQKICLQILEKNSEDFDTLYLLGIINFQKKNYDSANKLFEKAIEINFDDAGIYNYNAISLVKLKKFSSANHSKLLNQLKNG